MPSLPSRRALIFDFGNTLAPFNAPEADGVDGDLADVLARAAGIDRAAAFSLWRAERLEDFKRSAVTGVEHDFRDRVRRVLARAGRAADEDVAGAGEAAAIESFVRRVRVSGGIRAALTALASSYRLGVLSNYLLAEPIHRVLARDGIAPLCAAAVVSKEVGYAKPHRRAFEAILERLAVPPEAAVYVGDDWHADIAGSLACGLAAVWTWAMVEPKPELPPALPEGVTLLPTREEYEEFLRSPARYIPERGRGPQPERRT